MAGLKLALLKKVKKGNSYLQVENDLKLTKGQYLSVFNPRKKPGITEADLAKIPDFVVADVLIGPERD